MLPAEIENVEQPIKRRRPRPVFPALDLRQCLAPDANARGKLRLGPEGLIIELTLTTKLQKRTEISTQPTGALGQQHTGMMVMRGHVPSITQLQK